MGFALGVIGMSLRDFCSLTPEEWREVCRGWHASRDQASHETWEQTRWLGTVTVQPHVRKRLSPRDLLRLPWDEAVQNKDNAPRMSREERERRMAAAIRRMGATYKSEE